jgi:hypothetical protein
MRQAWLRFRQGLRALAAFARPVDTAAAQAVLSLELMGLFRRMRRSEQQHSLRVMRTLQAQGYSDPALLTAALLHDAGKSRYPFTLVERTLVVLARKALPRQYAAWSRAGPWGWRRMFAIAAQHPVWSAEDMAAAGAPELAVRLARRHQEPPIRNPQSAEDRLLAALQAADGNN